MNQVKCPVVSGSFHIVGWLDDGERLKWLKDLKCTSLDDRSPRRICCPRTQQAGRQGPAFSLSPPHPWRSKGHSPKPQFTQYPHPGLQNRLLLGATLATPQAILFLKHLFIWNAKACSTLWLGREAGREGHFRSFGGEEGGRSFLAGGGGVMDRKPLPPPSPFTPPPHWGRGTMTST